MINGLNHITIAVADLERSVGFYKDLLGFELHVSWQQGAYFSAGNLWFCLTVDPPCEKTDYTHIAFTVDAELFHPFCEKLERYGVQRWKKNSSEGDSMYFLDPDGHRLEVHVGNLQSRLESLREKPYANLEWH